MTDREQAIQRLRSAAFRLGNVTADLAEAQKELSAAAQALDEIDNADLPTAEDVRGIIPRR